MTLRRLDQEPEAKATVSTGFLSKFRSWHRRAMAYAGLPVAAAKEGLVLMFAYGPALAIAYGICRVLPVSSGPLDEVRLAGIMSQTIFAEYPKHHEWTLYLVAEFIVALVVLAVWWGWTLWGGIRHARRPRSASDEEGMPDLGLAPPSASLGHGGQADPSAGSIRAAVIEWLLVSALILFVAFDIRRFVMAGHGWTFLEEEGLTLATIDALLRGGVLYRDVLTAYGPLVFYPAKWLMRLLDPSTLVLRGYFFALDYAGFLLLYYLMKALIRHRGLALAGLGFFLLNFSMPLSFDHVYRPSAQFSVLRFSIGMAWLMFYLRHGNRPTRQDLVAAGLALGVALALSIEIGLVACITLLVLAAIRLLWAGTDFLAGARELSWVGAGIAVVLLPIAGYLAMHGSLAEAIAYWLSFMRHTALGYASLPFPTPTELIQALPSLFDPVLGIDALKAAKGYWIPLMLNVGCVLLLRRWLLGKLDQTDGVVLGLVLMGAALFRIALGVSDVTHFQASLVPTVLLGLVLLRRFMDSVHSGWLPVRSWTVVVGVALCLLSVLALQPMQGALKTFIGLNSFPWSVKFVSPDSPAFRPVSGVPRARGLLLEVRSGQADEFEATVRYIVGHTDQDEPIIAFPNEGAYYFYTARPNASRWSFLFEAMTHEDRLAVIQQWDARRPRYLIYSPARGMHLMPIPLQLPELYDYVKEHFVIEQRFGRTVIMRRRDL